MVICYANTYIFQHLYGFYHVGVGSQNQIRAVLSKDLCPVLLALIHTQIVLRPPVGAYNGKVRIFLCKLKVPLNLVLIQHIHCVGHSLWLWDPISSIGVIKDCYPDTFLFYNVDIVVGIFCFIYSNNCYLRMLLPPVFTAIKKPPFPLIQRMIGSVTYHIKSCLYQCITSLIRSIKSGVPGNTKFLSSNNDFLIDDGNVCATYIFFQILKNKVKII